MDHVLADELDVFAIVYLADILVFSKNEHDHAEHLRWVLTKLHEHKLKAKCKKSAFGLAELQYLGHIVKTQLYLWIRKKSSQLPNGLYPLQSKNSKHSLVCATSMPSS